MTPADELDEAFAAAPRADFLPDSESRFAAVDRALPIGHGQTNSQPSTIRAMLALLDVRPGHRVLDVGSGSGWSTALLAVLVGPDGEVIGVERVPELIEFGRRNLAKMHLPWARIEPALPDTLGLPDKAPYERILVSAEARRLPQPLVEQLDDEGVMVIPVCGWMQEVRRTGAGVEVVGHGAYAFVPLIGG